MVTTVPSFSTFSIQGLYLTYAYKSIDKGVIVRYNTRMKTERKRSGPIPGPLTAKITVLIEPDMIEWGKRQPGGLSATLRMLLRKSKESETLPKG